MKKIIALALAIALLLGCTFAIAEEAHPTPHISSFANMKTVDNGQYITIYLDKPVDKLFVQWHNAGGKIVPEQLEVIEVGDTKYAGYPYQATALKNGHKYMPGTTQSYKPWAYTDVIVSEQIIPADATKDEVTLQIWQFGIDNLGWCIDVENPQYLYNKAGELLGSVDGVITAWERIINHISTVSANAGQAAYITVQGDWVVSYNRGGLSGAKIVKIVYNDGLY
jgi:hypothetical protein